MCSDPKIALKSKKLFQDMATVAKCKGKDLGGQQFILLMWPR